MDETVFDELKNDHTTQRTLMRLMLKTNEGTKGRKELFQRFRAALEAHAAAEDRVLYSPLLADAVGRRHAAHSIGEHEEIRDMLESLAQTDPDSPEWIKRAQVLVKANKHHMDEEEHDIFPLAREALSRTEVKEMSREYPEVRLEEAVA
ncbi:MAG: hemerythrin domain-containing protein [Polyangiales bacterium]